MATKSTADGKIDVPRILTALERAAEELSVLATDPELSSVATNAIAMLSETADRIEGHNWDGSGSVDYGSKSDATPTASRLYR